MTSANHQNQVTATHPDVDSGLASGQVLGTPTLFIDGVVHRGGYDPPTLLAALASLAALACRPLG